MKGWILSLRHQRELNADRDYEIFRYLEEAKNFDIDVRIIQSSQVDMIVTRDDRRSVIVDGETTELPEFILVKTGDGSTYYDLSVMRHMLRVGVPVFNNPYSIEHVKDKLHTQQILAASNLPVPKTMLAKHPINIDAVEKNLGFPVVIKTLSGSLGTGVLLAETRDKLIDFFEFVETMKPNCNIILQQFIGEQKEIADLRVFVVGGRVVGCMKRISQDLSFKTNISRGARGEKFSSTPEIEWLAIEVTKSLGLDISGVDLLFDGGSFKVCEANTAPQFKGLEKYCEVNVARSIWEYLILRLG